MYQPTWKGAGMPWQHCCTFSICAVVIFVGGCPFMGRVYEEDLDNDRWQLLSERSERSGWCFSRSISRESTASFLCQLWSVRQNHSSGSYALSRPVCTIDEDFSCWLGAHISGRRPPSTSFARPQGASSFSGCHPSVILILPVGCQPLRERSE